MMRVVTMQMNTNDQHGELFKMHTLQTNNGSEGFPQMQQSCRRKARVNCSMFLISLMKRQGIYSFLMLMAAPASLKRMMLKRSSILGLLEICGGIQHNSLPR